MDIPRTAVIVMILALLLPGASPTVASADPEELAAIEETVRLYMDGGRLGDLARLREAFHPGARLQFARDGLYQEWSLDEYLGRLTPGRRSSQRSRILSIDCAGSSATAKLESDHGSFKFIDYLSLLKIEGRWRIVNKVFHRVEN